MDSTKKFDHPNPHQSANFLSKLLFWWTIPIFRRGLKNDLETKDLYNTLKEDYSEPLGNVLETNWNKELISAKKNNRDPQLLNAIKKTFGVPYAIHGIFLLIQACVIKIAQPIILGKFINYFNSTSDSTQIEAYANATGVVILSILSILIMHNCSFGQQRLGMRCRIACCSLVYRKMLRLSRVSLNQTQIGQVINLLSNDVSRFDLTPLYLHYIWIMPIQTLLSAYFMYDIVGAAALGGILFIIIQAVPIQGYLSKLQAQLRLKIALRTDERVRVMNEIISGIQVIKMYAWEKPFEKVVEMTRKLEIDVLTRTSYIRGFSLALMVFTERTVLYITVVTYVLSGYQLSGDKVFPLAQFFNNVQLFVAIFFAIGLALYGEARISVKRLEAFLLQEENPKANSPNMIIEGKEQGSIYVKKVRASWVPHSIADTLNNFNITIEPGTLCAVVGPVGAGKSSFLQLLLGELIPHVGTVTVSGSVSYASQAPWLFVSSIRKNILFGQPYDRERYYEVVKACALERDFTQFPYGDKTLVGERGVSLSGGQRARINLARAIYRRGDIYLLDDPLSAVDPHVSKHLFEECITKYLANKTRILVTHQIQYLKNADLIIVINNGLIEKMGTYEELKTILSHIELDHHDHGDDSPEKPKLSEITRQRLMSIQSNTTTSSNMEEEQEPEETHELMEKGTMSGSVYKQYWHEGGSWALLLFLIFSLIIAQIASSGCDYWVTYWTNQEKTRTYHHLIESSTDPSFYSSLISNFTSSTEPYNTTDYSDITTPFENATDYSDITTIFENTTDTFMEPDEDISNSTNFDVNTTDSSEDSLHNNTFNDDENLFSTYTSIYIYTFCIIGSIVLTTLRSLVFFKVCMNVSKGLHDKMFNNILQATMRFFDTNPSGRILNRFSKDMGAVDELLPKAMLEALQILLVMSGILTMIMLVNPWMIIPMVIMGVIFYFVRVIYLSAAQDIKRLEGITRSPVFSHVGASLDGITTIRASGAQVLLQKEFDIHQDLHTRSWFLIIATNCAFGFCLDVISVIFLAIVTYSFLLIDNGNVYSGNVGLAISQSLILTGMLQYGMRQTAEVVNQMTSVERVLQYTKLEKEGPFESELGKKPPKEWPQKGQIEFKHLYLRYCITDMPVLKNLNVVITPGQKVGIVGRTGAGKSSLMSALFRLAPIDGSIIIDGMDTKSVGLTDLRSSISIIPQEPVLFSATIRHNLDPFKKCMDAELWQALEEVELKDAVDSLDHAVSEGGSNFSAGQRQLVCLARAILRKNKILILDEATANVDPQTDSFIQQTIRKKFVDCTVLTIAHRLNTIMDSEKILVMDNGEMVEFDHPHLLLQNSTGYFTKMVQETGKSMEQNLRQIAKNAFNDKITTDLNDLNLEIADNCDRNEE